MEVTGTIIYDLKEQTGTSKAGNPWKKHEYVLEVPNENFSPRRIHFDFFGDKADQYPLSVGQTVTLSFDIESREYNGRWFTSIRGWKAVDASQAGAAAPAPRAAAPAPTPAPPQPAAYNPAPVAEDDLPF